MRLLRGRWVKRFPGDPAAATEARKALEEGRVVEVNAEALGA